MKTADIILTRYYYGPGGTVHDVVTVALPRWATWPRDLHRCNTRQDSNHALAGKWDLRMGLAVDSVHGRMRTVSLDASIGASAHYTDVDQSDIVETYWRWERRPVTPGLRAMVAAS